MTKKLRTELVSRYTDTLAKEDHELQNFYYQQLKNDQEALAQIQITSALMQLGRSTTFTGSIKNYIII